MKWFTPLFLSAFISCSAYCQSGKNFFSDYRNAVSFELANPVLNVIDWYLPPAYFLGYQHRLTNHLWLESGVEVSPTDMMYWNSWTVFSVVAYTGVQYKFPIMKHRLFLSPSADLFFHSVNADALFSNQFNITRHYTDTERFFGVGITPTVEYYFRTQWSVCFSAINVTYGVADETFQYAPPKTKAELQLEGLVASSSPPFDGIRNHFEIFKFLDLGVKYHFGLKKK